MTIGSMDGLWIVVVAHTVTDAEIIRIISARKAERHERTRDEQGVADL